MGKQSEPLKIHNFDKSLVMKLARVEPGVSHLRLDPLHLADTGGPVTRPIREIAPILTSNLVNLI